MPPLARAVRGALLVGVLGAVACAPPVPSPAARPTVGGALPAPIDSLAAPWFPRARGGALVQEILLVSALRSRVDSTERLDSLRAVIGVEWSHLGGAPARVSGLLTEFRVSGDTAAPMRPAGLRVPIPFAGLEGRDGTQLTVERPDVAGCGPDAAALQAVREAMLALPARLEAGTTWADSARYTVCRDSIPLAVGSVRTYRVVGAERLAGAIVLLVDRESRVTMRGAGSQFGEWLSIEASGRGAMRLVVRLDGAVVVQGRGESTLDMTMRGRRRTQTLSQHTRLEITSP